MNVLGIVQNRLIVYRWGCSKCRFGVAGGSPGMRISTTTDSQGKMCSRRALLAQPGGRVFNNEGTTHHKTWVHLQ